MVLPRINNLIVKLRTHSYSYSYKLPKNMKAVDVSGLPPAKSVPFLIYHGVVVSSEMGENSSRKNFISQMEMLKKEGYQTISIKEFDDWRNGNFVLPPKPIIITFDDGRKDSYFTVDEILKKLGFKATIFIATNSVKNNPFFLNWEILKKMKSSGRWEIEAHGRDSHLKVQTDKEGNIGNFLASRIYDPNTGLESVNDYEKRIEQEYINGKDDLLKFLGIDAKYYAIPLNSYGVYTPDLTNYSGAFAFNDKMTRKYYEMAFVQAYVKDDKVESFFNYKNSDLYNIKRLQVKNMNPEILLNYLNIYSDIPINLSFPDKKNELVDKYLHVLYGPVSADSTSVVLKSNSITKSTRVVIGDIDWQDYSVEIEVKKEKGTSFSMLLYYKDEMNNVNFDWSDGSLKLTQLVNGESSLISSFYPLANTTKKANISASILNGIVNIDFNGIVLKGSVNKKLSSGQVGFGVWDRTEAISSISKIKIKGIK